MKCMKCNSNLTQSGYCTHCGFNISHLIKSKNTAGWYYNQGLEKAKNRELSDAAALLEIALSFDKEHIDARNLLGLIYHEMGQVARAMHQWVISINIDIEDNVAVEYLQQYEDERAIQKVDRGVNLYNQTLYSARLQKEGMALLKIEECCFVAPKFVDAHLLRALLYMNKKDWEQAQKAIKDVLKIDRHNATALRYLREIPGYDADKSQDAILDILLPATKKKEEKIEQAPVTKQEQQKVAASQQGAKIQQSLPQGAGQEQQKGTANAKNIATSQGVSGETKAISNASQNEEKNVTTKSKDIASAKTAHTDKKAKKGNGYLKVVAGIVAGIAMGVIVMWALLVPHNQSFDKQVAYVQNQISENNGQNGKSSKSTTEAASDTKASVKDYAGSGKKRGAMDYMVLAMGYYKDGDAIKAAKTLIKVDEDLLKSNTSKDKYDEIKKSTFGEASTQLFNSGKESYDEQNYDDAADDLEMAYKLDDSNVEAYYYLGLTYQAQGKKEKAKKVYEEINNKFKGSDREHDAADRLKEMGY